MMTTLLKDHTHIGMNAFTTVADILCHELEAAYLFKLLMFNIAINNVKFQHSLGEYTLRYPRYLPGVSKCFKVGIRVRGCVNM